MNFSDSHKTTLELLFNNKLKSPLPRNFYASLGENWAGPQVIKRIIENFISINPLEVYYITPQLYSEVSSGILNQKLINNVKSHVSNRHGILLFSSEMQPIDLEEINNPDNELIPQFDSLFFSAISNYDYWKVGYKETEKRMKEMFSNLEEEKKAGTLTIVPVYDGFVNTISSHLETNNELYLDDYEWNDRESYGNIMDFTLLFLYLVDMNVIKGRNEFMHGTNKIITFSL